MKTRRPVQLLALTILAGVLALPASVAEARFTRRNAFITVAFDGDCEQIIANQIQSARRELLIAIYSMTSQRLEDLVVRAAQRGVTVRMKYDAGQAAHASMQRVIARFEEAGIECVPISLRRSRASMHHKFIVVDGLRVVTGSANFSQMAADSNFENCVLIENQQVARDFADVFESIEDR